MKKFDKTTLGELTIGDRFYFLGDTIKRVFEVKSIPGRRTDAKLIGTGRIVRKPSNTEVVFLTSKSEREAL